jgi:succinoglycan biosynthesis protein ExoM
MSEPPADVITVALCTFRRPAVRDALASLAGQDLPQGWRMHIIVADNDDAPSAQEIVQRMAAKLELELSYVHAPARNISTARNACLDVCDSRFLAFMDDDEIAAPDWLARLLDRARVSRAGVVLGPVNSIYPSAAPDWMSSADTHSTRPVWVRGRIQTGYTCNVLLDRDDPALSGLRFDTGFGVSGGEDSDFFGRYFAKGGQFAFAEDAVIHEEVPLDRATLRWLLMRRFRMGQTHVDIFSRRQTALLARLAFFPMAAGKFCATAALGFLFLAAPKRGVPQIMRAALHLGVMARLLGLSRLQIYRSTDGG